MTDAAEVIRMTLSGPDAVELADLYTAEEIVAALHTAAGGRWIVIDAETGRVGRLDEEDPTDPDSRFYMPDYGEAVVAERLADERVGYFDGGIVWAGEGE